MATELPDLLRRGQREASDGPGETGPPWQREQGPCMRGGEHAAWMPAHTPLQGSDTGGFSKGCGSDPPMTFHLCLVLLHVLRGGFITNNLQAQNSAYLSSTGGNH